MNRLAFVRWVIACIIPIVLFGCGGRVDSGNSGSADSGSADNAITPQAAATVMIYVVGSDLESKSGAATNNLKDLVAATASKDVNVVVTTGAANKKDPAGLVADWTTVRRYVVQDGKLQIKGDLGKVNMVESKTLSDFVIWARNAYPATNYRLIMWDHGGGTQGFGTDEIFPNSPSMSLPAMQTALATAKQQTGIHFDLIGFDACLMATTEVASALAPYADYLAASEELEPGSGWDYRTVFSSLAAQPTMDPLQFGRVITDSYIARQKKDSDDQVAAGALARADSDITFSVTDLSRVAAVTEALAPFANELSSYAQQSTDNWTRLARERVLTTSFGAMSSQNHIADLADLGVFADRLTAAGITSDAGRRVSSAVRSAVVYRVNGQLALSASGLSIYFPSRQLTQEDSTQYAKLDFSPSYKSLVNAYVKFANLQTPLITIDTSRSSGATLRAAVTSAFGQKDAGLYMTWQTQTPGVVRVLAGRPIDVGSSLSGGITTKMDDDWYWLNGHLANVELLANETRTIDGAEKTVSSLGVGVYVNNEFSVLVFERVQGSETLTFVGRYEGEEGSSISVSPRIDNDIKSTDKVTLALVDYDLVKQDMVSVRPSDIAFDAGKLELKQLGVQSVTSDLRMMVSDFRETSRMTDPIPHNF
ncbi:clostripain-related cysteine peptidase [Paraburkholderia ginsengiterrae]|uniref:clostripain-related cysteine peptidase n=1 Tax=Paraburkholderia ginsengiterrae TaxID=1462993 RepID=UPI000AB6ECFE|nr:clostripain-related cysteine peptidase [Paraburkholderia ginsengiterrae]